MLANLTILAKFRQIRQISHNYADYFTRCHPAMMADLVDMAILADLAVLAKFRKFVKLAKIMQMILDVGGFGDSWQLQARFLNGNSTLSAIKMFLFKALYNTG